MQTTVVAGRTRRRLVDALELLKLPLWNPLERWLLLLRGGG
ncbi:MAG: hypothetical protein ACRDRI_16370 [Pseudonocardiaceae bacterium]